MSVSSNLSNIRAALPSGVELVAVSKFRPVEELVQAYAVGQRIFGESRPQEMASKRPLLPPDVRWHQIGHLQTNKVRLIAPFVELVHSADSVRLLWEIDRRAAENGRVIDVLLEIRVASEATKHGWEWPELVSWLEGGEFRRMESVGFRGVMGMASFTEDGATVEEEFGRLRGMFGELRERFFGGDGGVFDILSMGMSGDWPLALRHGSTMVRLGSAIF